MKRITHLESVYGANEHGAVDDSCGDRRRSDIRTVKEGIKGGRFRRIAGPDRLNSTLQTN